MSSLSNTLPNQRTCSNSWMKYFICLFCLAAKIFYGKGNFQQFRNINWSTHIKHRFLSIKCNKLLIISVINNSSKHRTNKVKKYIITIIIKTPWFIHIAQAEQQQKQHQHDIIFMNFVLFFLETSQESVCVGRNWRTNERKKFRLITLMNKFRSIQQLYKFNL